MIDTRFEDEAVGTDVSSSPDWDYATGYVGSLNFRSSVDGGKCMKLDEEDIEIFVGHVDVPLTPHQRVEAQFRFKSRAIVVPQTYTASSGDAENVHDEDNGTEWITDELDNDRTLTVDFGTGKALRQIEYRTPSSGLGSACDVFEFRGSNDPTFATSELLFTSPGGHATDTEYESDFFLPASNYRYYRFIGGETNFGFSEVRFYEGTPTTTDVTSGVFARYVDADNHVRVVVDHATRQAELIETIEGVETVLLNPSLTASGGTTGFSVALEVIGRRARMWFQPNRRSVEDVPPLDAVDLAAGEPTVSGQWGVFVFTDNGASNAEVQHFIAKDLPAVHLPAPTVSISDATDLDVSLVPIEASVSDLPSDAMLIWWEVYPYDPKDWPECQQIQTIPSITTMTFHVRPGYEYLVRARAERTNGLFTDWEEDTITADGVKVEPDLPTYPDLEFPDVTPDVTVECTHTWPVTVKTKSAGQTTAVSLGPGVMRAWNLTFKNRQSDEVKLLERFIKNKAKGSQHSFQWNHPAYGTKHAVKFGQDELILTPVDHQRTDDSPPLTTVEVKVVEVVEDATTDIDTEFEGDDDII